jgi:hypothetical protein
MLLTKDIISLGFFLVIVSNMATPSWFCQLILSKQTCVDLGESRTVDDEMMITFFDKFETDCFVLWCAASPHPPLLSSF